MTFTVGSPQQQLTWYYRQAIRAYRSILGDSQVILALIDERSYCDAYVRQLPPITWTSTGANFERFDADEAYRVAVREES